MPEVLATAMMIGFMEQTCIQALRPYLTCQEHTVGTHVDMSHISATPTGMRITARVQLTAVDGKALTFKVECSDESGMIGQGVHARTVIDLERFNARVQKKASQFL